MPPMFAPTFRCWGVFALLIVGCATTHPTREAGSAILESRRTVVASIDDLRAGGTNDPEAKFEIPAGRHSVDVGLPSVATAMPRPADPGKTITVCFDAIANRRYVTQPIFEGDRWRPEIVDIFARVAVSSACAEMHETIGAANDSAMASAPRLEQKLGPASLPVPPRPLLRDLKLPGTGLTAGVGFFGGGDSLYRVEFDNGRDQVLTAGRGVLATIGALWTPLWIDDQFGFGAGASMGWKYDSITASNGEVWLTRFPLTATVHTLIRLSKRWFALLSGGLGKEVGGKISGSGLAAEANHTFTSTLGLLGEGALYCTLGHATLGAALRRSSSKDRLGGAVVDASSLGVIAASHYTF